MDTIIAVAIILGIVGFLAYKNKDKLTALLNRASDDGLDADPEPATPYKVEPVAPAAAPAPAAEYNGEGDPPSQEAWTAWRNRQPASTRAYIPEVWKPVTVDAPQPVPAPEEEAASLASAKFGTNGTKRYKLSTRFLKIPIPHPKGIKANLKVSVVESLETTKGTKYTVEIAGDNVPPNHYEWEWHGGTINTVIDGDSHEIRIKANQATECFVRYGWTKA